MLPSSRVESMVDSIAKRALAPLTRGSATQTVPSLQLQVTMYIPFPAHAALAEYPLQKFGHTAKSEPETCGQTPLEGGAGAGVVARRRVGEERRRVGEGVGEGVGEEPSLHSASVLVGFSTLEP